MVCLSRPCHFKMFKDCFPQISLVSNTLSPLVSIFMKMDIVPLHPPLNFNVGKTTHVESKEVSVTLYQGGRKKHVSILWSLWHVYIIFVQNCFCSTLGKVLRCDVLIFKKEIVDSKKFQHQYKTLKYMSETSSF